MQENLSKTEELGKLARQMIQLRAVRDFAKEERKNAQPRDAYVWEHLYRVVLESAVLTEQSIARLLPTGVYHYFRDLPEP